MRSRPIARMRSWADLTEGWNDSETGFLKLVIATAAAMGDELAGLPDEVRINGALIEQVDDVLRRKSGIDLAPIEYSRRAQILSHMCLHFTSPRGGSPSSPPRGRPTTRAFEYRRPALLSAYDSGIFVPDEDEDEDQDRQVAGRRYVIGIQREDIVAIDALLHGEIRDLATLFRLKHKGPPDRERMERFQQDGDGWAMDIGVRAARLRSRIQRMGMLHRGILYNILETVHGSHQAVPKLSPEDLKVKPRVFHALTDPLVEQGFARRQRDSHSITIKIQDVRLAARAIFQFKVRDDALRDLFIGAPLALERVGLSSWSQLTLLSDDRLRAAMAVPGPKSTPQ